MANRRGKVETVTDFIFLGFKITADSDGSYKIQTLCPWQKHCDKQCIKKQTSPCQQKVHTSKL